MISVWFKSERVVCFSLWGGGGGGSVACIGYYLPISLLGFSFVLVW